MTEDANVKTTSGKLTDEEDAEQVRLGFCLWLGELEEEGHSPQTVAATVERVLRSYLGREHDVVATLLYPGERDLIEWVATEYLDPLEAVLADPPLEPDDVVTHPALLEPDDDRCDAVSALFTIFWQHSVEIELVLAETTPTAVRDVILAMYAIRDRLHDVSYELNDPAAKVLPALVIQSEAERRAALDAYCQAVRAEQGKLAGSGKTEQAVACDELVNLVQRVPSASVRDPGGGAGVPS